MQPLLSVGNTAGPPVLLNQALQQKLLQPGAALRRLLQSLQSPFPMAAQLTPFNTSFVSRICLFVRLFVRPFVPNRRWIRIHFERQYPQVSTTLDRSDRFPTVFRPFS